MRGSSWATARDPIVQGTIAVYTGPDGASASLARFLDDLRSRQLHGVTDGPAPALGDESYRLEATNSDGAAITVFGWRRENLVLVVIVTAIPPAQGERLARLVDGRAASVAAPG